MLYRPMTLHRWERHGRRAADTRNESGAARDGEERPHARASSISRMVGWRRPFPEARARQRAGYVHPRRGCAPSSFSVTEAPEVVDVRGRRWGSRKRKSSRSTCVRSAARCAPKKKKKEVGHAQGKVAGRPFVHLQPIRAQSWLDGTDAYLRSRPEVRALLGARARGSQSALRAPCAVSRASVASDGDHNHGRECCGVVRQVATTLVDARRIERADVVGGFVRASRSAAVGTSAFRATSRSPQRWSLAADVDAGVTITGPSGSASSLGESRRRARAPPCAPPDSAVPAPARRGRARPCGSPSPRSHPCFSASTCAIYRSAWGVGVGQIRSP